MSQQEALHRTLEAVELPDGSEALVELCRGLAEAVDENPDRASLWKEYHSALDSLYTALAAVPAEEDDGQAAFLELVRTPVGDTKKPRKKDARAGA